MEAWLTDLQHWLTHGHAAVLITVARVDGSAPREAGTKMLVKRDAISQTIGGGHLEWKAIDIARRLLRDSSCIPHPRQLERIALGPALGQCCGGAVVLSFERLDSGDLDWVATLLKRLKAGIATVRNVSFGGSPQSVMLTAPTATATHSDCLLWETADTALLTETLIPPPFNVTLFGAGHVGTALIQVLATLPCHVHWIDERDAYFPAADVLAKLTNITPESNDVPEEAVDHAAPQTYFVVMTHTHARDFALAERILRRGDYAYFGVIGSHTKRRQFERRLALRGLDPSQITPMRCPIGIAGVTSKSPAAIALATGVQILQTYEAREARHRTQHN